MTLDALAAQANVLASDAAKRLGLRIAELHTMAELDALAELLCRIWRAESPEQVVGSTLLKAFAQAGNYVVGAYHDEELVAGSVAFFGAGHLHSHITGVAHPGRGIGYALKQHQRAWALARGITDVRWTFDPLVRRNAHVNLNKLGAVPIAYLPNCYGQMPDGLNADDESDRLYVSWRLDSPRVIEATRDALPEPNVAGAAMLLDRVNEEPVVTGQPAGARALVAVPADIEQLRLANPSLAARWRVAVRHVLGDVLSAGYTISAMTRDGYYVVERA